MSLICIFAISQFNYNTLPEAQLLDVKTPHLNKILRYSKKIKEKKTYYQIIIKKNLPLLIPFSSVLRRLQTLLLAFSYISHPYFLPHHLKCDTKKEFSKSIC